MPTACVFVIVTGSESAPASSIQTVPVISPLPLSEQKPAAQAVPGSARPRGWIAVTPVRTGPLPDDERALARDQRRVADLDARARR